MCLMLPMTVEAVDGPAAWVRVGCDRLLVNRMALDELAVGDMVLVSNGICIQRLDPERAAAIRRALSPDVEGIPQGVVK